METRLVLEHCQLAILNFYVFIRYTRFQIRNTTNKHVLRFILSKQYTPIGLITSGHAPDLYWRPGLDPASVGTSGLEPRLILETRTCIRSFKFTVNTKKIGERWNSPVLGWKVWLTPRYTPLPHSVTTPNLVVLRQQVYA